MFGLQLLNVILSFALVNFSSRLALIGKKRPSAGRTFYFYKHKDHSRCGTGYLQSIFISNREAVVDKMVWCLCCVNIAFPLSFFLSFFRSFVLFFLSFFFLFLFFFFFFSFFLFLLSFFLSIFRSFVRSFVRSFCLSSFFFSSFFLLLLLFCFCFFVVLGLQGDVFTGHSYSAWDEDQTVFALREFGRKDWINITQLVFGRENVLSFALFFTIFLWGDMFTFDSIDTIIRQ